MESLLVGVTFVSLFLAVAMAVVAWTLIRGERERAAARIEALEALAFEPAVEPAVAVEPAAAIEPAVQAARGDEPHAIAETPADAPQWDAALGATAAIAHRADRVHWSDYAAASHADGMFDTTKTPRGNGARWVAVAAVGLVIAAGYVTATVLRLPKDDAAAVTSTSERESDLVPLELVSLRHTIASDGAFVVTGLVQNPSSGRDVRSAEAVVYLFDDQDQYFTSGRAHLDASTLGPGSEASFEVRIPNVSGVSRYRVGFRESDGVTIAHLDRRGRAPGGVMGGTVTGGDIVRPAGGMRPMGGEAGR